MRKGGDKEVGYYEWEDKESMKNARDNEEYDTRS